MLGECKEKEYYDRAIKLIDECGEREMEVLHKTFKTKLPSSVAIDERFRSYGDRNNWESCVI